MKSRVPKVLHQIAGQSMLRHVLDAVEAANPDRIVVVVGPGMERVAEAAQPHRTAVQKDRLGTGHAVGCAREALADLLANSGAFDLLVAFGDTPLMRTATLQAMRAQRHGSEQPADLVGLAFRARDPAPYGRVLLDPEGRIDRVVEARDANAAESAVDLCNAGLLLGDGHKLFDWIAGLSNDNAKGEYYLTELFAMARADGLAARYVEATEEEVMGVNDRMELAWAATVMQDRLRRQAMAGGATLEDPASVRLSWDSRLGRDVVVEPNVYFGPGVQVGEGARIRAFSHIEGADIGPGAQIGPYARLRPGTVLEANARIGNFVEVKNARFGVGAKANHLTYVGDATVGAGANIGAGTITCNYDGFAKSRTEIGAGAFIGSNSALVAPVRIGEGALVAAGSVIVQDVEPDALALGRARQTNRPGGAAQFRAARQKSKDDSGSG